MKFVSTRGQAASHTFSEAVAAGLAPDGGLFVPETLPDILYPRLNSHNPQPPVLLCHQNKKA